MIQKLLQLHWDRFHTFCWFAPPAEAQRWENGSEAKNQYAETSAWGRSQLTNLTKTFVPHNDKYQEILTNTDGLADAGRWGAPGWTTDNTPAWGRKPVWFVAQPSSVHPPQLPVQHCLPDFLGHWVKVWEAIAMQCISVCVYVTFLNRS